MKIIALMLVVFCSSYPAHSQLVTNSVRETNVLYAVFRYQIAHCYKDRQPTTYFLSYKDQDPKDIVMARFLSIQSSVKRRSQVSYSKDKPLGERAVILDIGSIDWQNKRKATITGSCESVNGSDAYSYLYSVRLKNRKWIVTHSRMTGAS